MPSGKHSVRVEKRRGSRYVFQSPNPPRKSTDEIHSIGTDLIRAIVGVGQDQQSFWVDTARICERSRFFKNAMQSPWKESSTQIVRLPDCNPEIFAMYLELVYTDKVACNPIAENNLDSETDFRELFELYVLCDHHMDSTSKNLVLAAAIEDTYVPNHDDVAYAYENTVSGSPLRKWLADLYAERACSVHMEAGSLDDFPKEFLFDVVCTTIANRDEPEKEWRSSSLEHYKD
ncbi:hypothetical protein P171DRAFT_360502 [Karstenula rhodostoma CBS 690.94]|uniref:BTB domain-containing protein n=1 Tax=Karstenula rhodostoma CBS 690.94 TaxID=1392251 RepID=A0A9P4PG65_9PLEO|nr:hypothetical protein P171DRAFT_360502 [Karstenula rhodostoma CBS 690.94]